MSLHREKGNNGTLYVHACGTARICYVDVFRIISADEETKHQRPPRQPMQDTEVLQVKGYITVWKRSYGFAKVNFGGRCVDVFVHSGRFDTHQDRK